MDWSVKENTENYKLYFLEIEGGVSSVMPHAEFDVSGMSHPRIDRHHPAFLAKGGENLVYTLENKTDGKDVVVKAAIAPLIWFIDQNIQRGLPINNFPTAPDSDKRFEASEMVDSENSRYHELAHYFGEEHMMEQSKHFWKVPIDEQTVRKLYEMTGREAPPDLSARMAREAWTFVTVQERIKRDPNTISTDLIAGYAESVMPEHRSSEYNRAYATLTEALVLHPDMKAPIDPETFYLLHRHLRDVVDRASIDTAFNTAVSDFVSKAITYSNETGSILDLAGSENVLFLKDQNGSWNYKLLDALYPNPSTSKTSFAREQFTGLKAGSADSGGNIMNPINYVRGVNGLASLLGVSDRVTAFASEGEKYTGKDIQAGIDAYMERSFWARSRSESAA